MTRPLNIAREIAQIRARPGDNYLAMALERIQDHLNKVVPVQIAAIQAAAPVTPAAAAPTVVTGPITSVSTPSSPPFVNPVIGGVNSQTGTTYTLQATDLGRLVTLSNVAAVAVTLPDPASLNPKFFCFLENLNAGVVTLTPAAGTIDGAASLTLIKNMGILLFSDGANYWTDRGLPAVGGVNGQTGVTYTVLPTDNGKLVTCTNASAVAVTLPTASTMPANFYCSIENLGAGAVTLTPATGTIDGKASLALAQYQGVGIYSNGTNWFSVRGLPVSVVAGGVNVQTAAYSVVASDNSKLIVMNSTSSVQVTLPAANTVPKFYCVIENIGVGQVKVAPSAGLIDGANYILLGSYTGIWIFADDVGNTWYAETGVRLAGVNAQTASYSTTSGDEGKLITMNAAGATTITLVAPASGYLNYHLSVQNLGAGVCTLSPSGVGVTIDGLASLALNQNQGVQVFYDGTNWFTERGRSDFAPLFTNGINIGIGTQSPDQALTIDNSVNQGTIHWLVGGSTVGYMGQANAIIIGGASYEMGIRAANDLLFAADGNTEAMRIKQGQLGIGTPLPTATLTLKAGSATPHQAPLKLTAGTNLTTPEAGAVEWDGTNLYITQGAGPTRQTISTSVGMTNPMVSSGDMIIGGTGGAPTRLNGPAALNNSTLLITGGTPTWTSLWVPGSASSISANGKAIIIPISNNPSYPDLDVQSADFRTTGIYTRNSDYLITNDVTLYGLFGTGLTNSANGYYSFRYILYITASSTGGMAFQLQGFSGLAATWVAWHVTIFDDNTNSIVFSSKQITFGTVGYNGATQVRVEIDGALKCSLGGDLFLSIGQRVASGTTTVQQGSHLWLFKSNG